MGERNPQNGPFQSTNQTNIQTNISTNHGSISITNHATEGEKRGQKDLGVIQIENLSVDCAEDLGYTKGQAET
jgi:hypothetical protein